MTSATRLRRYGVALLAMTMLSTACGLKPEAKDALRQGNPGLAGGDGTDTGAGAPVDADGDGQIDPGEGVDADGDGQIDPGTGPGSGPGNAPGSGPSAGPGASRGPGTGGPSSGPAPVPEGPGTTIGITDTEIKIGIHAPLSGASPLPQDSFNSGAIQYWADKKVFGRKVTVEVKDDTYKPSGAIRVCQEMARRDFIVIGGAGTDQIQACARDRTLQRTHTPYLSAGVTENSLGSIKTYFALSLTYKEQGPLLTRVAQQMGYLDDGKWAVVVSDTPNFVDAQQSIEGALRAKNVQFDTHKVPKSGNDQDASNLVSKLKSGKYPVIYFLGQPTFFLKVVQGTQDPSYKPIWTGVGISMGLNTVATVACTQTAGAYDGRFLSPYPGLDKAPPAFFKAGGKDDIQLTLWGLNELLHKALLLTGGKLTRENFTAQLARASLTGGTYPAVKYSPADHFGGTAAYMLKSQCTPDPRNSKYVTAGGPFPI